MGSPKIKVKAMGVFVADGRLLVMDCFNREKNTPFYRLLGGHVEFGEQAEEAFAREMREELDTAVAVHERLAVVQNIFNFEGKPHHEVVFIHRTTFCDETFNQREDLKNIEPDKDEPFIWVPIPQILEGPIPLYPRADYPGFLSRIDGL